MNAYLDPGTGSMVLSVLAGGIAGIVVFFKSFGHRIKSVLMFWKKDDDVADSADSAATDDEALDSDADPAATKV